MQTQESPTKLKYHTVFATLVIQYELCNCKQTGGGNSSASHLNCPNKKHYSGFSLLPIAVTKINNKKTKQKNCLLAVAIHGYFNESQFNILTLLLATGFMTYCSSV